MKALSLTQPWASLVAIGAKKIETRSWYTSYHGPIAIHAAKTFPGWAKDLAQGDPLFFLTLARAGYESVRDLEFGMIVATARLVTCTRTEIIADGHLSEEWWSDQEKRFGDYSPGRWGWLLADVQRLIKPVPARGALGLWDWQPGPDYERALGV